MQQYSIDIGGSVFLKKGKIRYKLASDMNYVMNELYKEQKEFLKENKCNVVEKKEREEAVKKTN